MNTLHLAVGIFTILAVFLIFIFYIILKQGTDNAKGILVFIQPVIVFLCMKFIQHLLQLDNFVITGIIFIIPYLILVGLFHFHSGFKQFFITRLMNIGLLTNQKETSKES